MKYTRIGLAIIFLFISIMLVMIAVRDSENRQAYVSSDLQNVLAPNTWEKCTVDSNGMNNNKPCASCNVAHITATNFTWGCQIDCSGKTCDPAKYKVSAEIHRCLESKGAAGEKGSAGGTNSCVSTSPEKIPEIGSLDVVSGQSTLKDNQTYTIAANTNNCGSAQVDIKFEGMPGNLPFAGNVFSTGVDCTTPPGVTSTLTPVPGVTSTLTPVPGVTLTLTPVPGVTLTLTPTIKPPTSSPVPPTATPTNTPTPTDSPTPTPSNTPTGTLTPTPTHTPKPTNTPTVAPSPTPGPVCAPAECGVCGWKDVAGLCHDGGMLPNGQRCCYKACAGNACTSRSGNALDSCASDAGCTGPTQPPVIASVAYKCDAKCGICGISDSGGLCADLTTLPNGQRCCHNACTGTGTAQSCVQASGSGPDKCTSAVDCAPGAPTLAIAPPVAPQPKPPVSGFLPWYIIAIPAGILLLGIIL